MEEAEPWMWNVAEEEHELGVCTWSALQVPEKGTTGPYPGRVCKPQSASQLMMKVLAWQKSLHKLWKVSAASFVAVSERPPHEPELAGWRLLQRQGSLNNSWAPVSQVDVSDASLWPEGTQEGCRPRLTNWKRGGRDGRCPGSQRQATKQSPSPCILHRQQHRGGGLALLTRRPEHEAHDPVPDASPWSANFGNRGPAEARVPRSRQRTEGPQAGLRACSTGLAPPPRSSQGAAGTGQ
uniref:Uncharacterized protein n=1 Tax=Piliocolobus tephrosceles TaxID=591936 RepID=A0A8C9GZD1_9PRIM